MSPVRELMGFFLLGHVVHVRPFVVVPHSQVVKAPKGALTSCSTHADNILPIEDRNLVFVQQALPDQIHSFLQRGIFFDVLEKIGGTLLTV